MRTLVTLSVLLSLSLVAFVATAAPPNPILLVSCTPDASGTNCQMGTTPTFSGSGLNSHKSYGVQGTSLQNGTFVCALATVDSQGNFSEPSCDGFAFPDTYTFTLWQLDKNGNLFKQVDGPYTFIFD